MDKEISEDRYFEMLGAVPPIYFTTLNGDHFKGSFALGEASSHINTPNGVKEAYLAFYKVGDKYYEVDGLIYFTQPLTAIRTSVVSKKIVKVEEVIPTIPSIEISRYTLKSNKRIEFLQVGISYDVIVIDTLTGDRDEYPITTDQTTAAKNYIEAIGKYGESKVISKGAFTKWLEKNELNIDGLVQYAEENGVTMDEVFAKGGKANPKKGHLLDKFVSGSEEKPVTQNPVTPPKVVNTEGVDVFYNPDIYVEEKDYVLGGFTIEEIGGIKVVGDNGVLSKAKLDRVFRDRIISKIESFKASIKTNLKNKDTSVYSVSERINDDLTNLFDSVGITLQDSRIEEDGVYDNEYLVDEIMQHPSYILWRSRIETRISNDYSNAAPTPLISNKPNPISTEDAQELTKNVTLQQIIEQLSNITENPDEH